MSFLVTNLIIPEGTRCIAETGPLSGPERGLLSSIWEWIFWGDTHAAKARDLTGKGRPRSGQPEGNGAQEDAPPGTHTLRFYGDGVTFRVVSGRSLWLRGLPGGACISQPRWMPARRILGADRMCGVTVWPFPNSPRRGRLESSVFLTRTSCCKITHRNGSYGDWTGSEVSVSGLPLTVSFQSIINSCQI